MNKDKLEYYLNKGNSFGYNTINDDSLLGWIILSKRFPIERFFERFTKQDDPVLFAEQESIRSKPYNIWIGKMKKDTYNSDRFPVNEDYIVNTNYAFSSLDEVEKFLSGLKYDLSDIKWSSDVEFL